ncbi:MAG: bifunctional 3-(3-hydroxy-phenyl)propionate/3-hydroxycinnamic acid hydroxylase [Steroidobacteraceae bacterium]
MENYDVAIVGYGPTGATLAHLLGECGLKAVVLERESAAYHLPRAVHFDAETMRIFQWIGIAEDMELKTTLAISTRFVDATGKVLMEWPRPQEKGPQGWYTSYLFHQPDLEDLLRDRMVERKSVTVKTRCDVFLVEDRGSEVELRYEDMSLGQIKRLKAKYVVGCDGARSLVRRFLESGLEDFGFHERWLVLDVVLGEDKRELGKHTIQYCVPERPATYVRGPGLRRRWEIMVRPEEDPLEIVKPERVWQLLTPWLKPEEGVIERAAVYTFHSVIAEEWRKGRLLLAGDAAHQTPPFLGQGMCAGIRDAANLYWKLALICQEKVAAAETERLLASYESERKPNAAEYIRTAMRLGGLINTSGTEEALRAAFPVAGGAARMRPIAPPLGSGLGVGAKAGRLFGQPRLADGRLMDEVYRHRFVVVAEPEFAEHLDLPQSVGLLTRSNSPDAEEHLARMETRAVVLRPDRYVLGVADTRTELNELVARILPSPSAAESFVKAK